MGDASDGQTARCKRAEFTHRGFDSLISHLNHLGGENHVYYKAVFLVAQFRAMRKTKDVSHTTKDNPRTSYDLH